MTAPGSPWRQLLAQAEQRLAAAGVASPAADARLLAAHALAVPLGDLLRRVALGEVPAAAVAQRFAELVARRAERVPLQHLTGRAAFRGLELEVGPGVFIPRPETEVVAEAVIAALRAPQLADRPADGAPLVVDLCTGSGAIGLAVAAEVPSARVVGIEADPAALAWAQRNIARHGLGERFEVRLGDVTDPALLAELRGQVDAVAANPPYIPPDAEPVDIEVRDHDPLLALYGGGDDGLEVPRAVIRLAAALLRPGGMFAMEHAETQAAAVRALLGAAGPGPADWNRGAVDSISGPVDSISGTADWTGVCTLDDLTGRPRAVLATRAPTR